MSFGFARAVPAPVPEGPPLPDGITPDCDRSEGLRASVSARAVRDYYERVIGISPARFAGLKDGQVLEALRAEGQNIARVEGWLSYIGGVVMAQAVCGTCVMGIGIVVHAGEVVAVVGRPKVPRPT